MSSESRAELELISRRGDWRAWDHCRRRILDGANLQVILIQDAVLETESGLAAALSPVGLDQLVVLACAEDASRRQLEERWPLIDYPAMISACVAAESVTSW